MPYLIITDKQQELDRHELSGPVVIGRAPDCDIVVRDILLSRHHCRIERDGDHWVVADLGSKNGTWIDARRIQRQILEDADVIRAGPKTRIIFRTGPFIPPPPDVIERKAARRPADPIEALAGTMVGFVLTDMEENSRVTGFPIPKPRKVEASGRHHPAEEDLKTPQKIPPSYYDLELRDVPAEMEQKHPEISADRGRAATSAESSHPQHHDHALREFVTAPQWTALILVLLAYFVCAVVVWLVVWR